MIEVIREEQYRVSNWSGGKTKELYLWPVDGSYADRDFRVRISSATVELPESDFTYLKGVQRYLMNLSGKMVLTINDGEEVDMKDGRILHFSGEDKVHCVGCATDFNLMLKGAEGMMFSLKPGESCRMRKECEYFVYGAQSFRLTGPDGTQTTVKKGESCYLCGEDGNFVPEGFEGVIPAVEISKKEGI